MKRILSLMIAVMLIVFNINVRPIKADDGTSFDTSKFKPVIKLYYDANIPTASAGQVFTLKVKVGNISDYQARTVVVTPIIGDAPLIVEGTASKTIDSINPKSSQDIEMRFQVSKDATEKIYTLKFKVEYRNSPGDEFSTEDNTVNISVKNSLNKSKVIIDSVMTNPKSISKGSDFELTLDLKNTGDFDISDIKISLDGLNKEGIALKSSSNTVYLEGLSSNASRYAKYKLSASKAIEAGGHGIRVKLEYRILSTQCTDEQEVFIWVDDGKTPETTPQISVNNIVSPQNGIAVNQDFNLSFSVQNNGGVARNLRVSLDIPNSEGISIYSVAGPTYQSLGDFGKGNKKDFNFKLRVGKPLGKNEDKFNGGTAVLGIKYEYDVPGKEGTQSQVQNIGVLILREGETPTSTGNSSIPKIIIDKYVSSPGIVKAGQNFDITVSFKNTNVSKQVRNIKIYLTVDDTDQKEGSVFTPVNSSNTFYIDSIAPKQSVERKMTMYTIPSANPKTYTIKANLEYEYDGCKDGGVTSTELIGIPVTQPSKVTTGEIVIPPDGIFVGSPIYINMDLYNMGKVGVSNLMVKVEGDFDTRTPNHFIGNFEAGGNENYENELIPKKEGALNGAIVVSYDEPNGEHKEEKKQFSVNVTQAPPPPPMPDDMANMNKNEKKFTKKKIFIIVGSVAAVAVITTVVIVKKKKKKKGMTIDE